MLERLALEMLAEQRRRRRWSVFFRTTLAFVRRRCGSWRFRRGPDGGAHGLMSLGGRDRREGRGQRRSRGGLLQAAFADAGTAGGGAAHQQPGGSPVQAGIISDEIVRLRALVPVFAVVEDICASGGITWRRWPTGSSWTRPASWVRSAC